MDSAAIFGWACLGAALTGVIIYLLPRWVHTLITGSEPLSKSDYQHAVLVIGSLTVIGGVFALIPEHIAHRGQAITYGLGVQAAIRGIVEAGKDAVRPLTDRNQGANTTGSAAEMGDESAPTI